jgi:hypothetical protein
MHAAESTAYSSMPIILPFQFKEDDGFSDVLFQAEDASTWRDMILQYRQKKEDIYLP